MENNPKTRLFCGTPCGTDSKKIYENYAEIFGWDISQSSQFGWQTPLYARNATHEGYSVWCIAYSNLNAKKSGNWMNLIFGDTIEELWKTRTYDYLHDFSDTTTRVVFAKNKKGQYEFFGVYKADPLPKELKVVEWYNTFGYVKKYRRISECYPMKAD